MTSEIAAAFTAFETLRQTAKGVLDLVRATDRQQILIDFNSQILDAQSSLFGLGAKYEELAKVKADLERQLMEVENWAGQAARYELKELAPGILVYSVKAGMEEGEPAHHVCPHCFQNRKRSILCLPAPGWTKYVCHQCKFEAVFKENHPIIGSVPRRPRRLDGF